jgi:hypothetical protein
MVNFGIINFNNLKGTKSVPAYGPNAWAPKQHRFVWQVNGGVVDNKASVEVLSSYNSLINHNISVPKRGSSMRPLSQTESYNNQSFSLNKAVVNNIQWSLFKKSSSRKGCSSCGSR